jgi:hypothetical protein
MTSKSRHSGNPVPLTPEQTVLRDDLRHKLAEILASIRSGGSTIAPDAIEDMGKVAAELHSSLQQTGTTVKHHKYMIENRRVNPDNLQFYCHVHPVEDLLKFLENSSANDDPEDQTLNHEFTIEVMSRRWGHKDSYHLKRTKRGWTIWRMEKVNTGRDGRIGGKPGTGLFDLLDHDSINYPEELPGYLEWAWTRAAEDGLSPDELQQALTELAEWVSIVESSSPVGIFKGYK